MGGDALKLSVIFATVIVLVIIAIMVEGAYDGYELVEEELNGCCCGVAAKAGEYYAAPTSQKCAADYAHVADLCSPWNCRASGS